MGNEVEKPFSNSQWLTIYKTADKEIIQHRTSFQFAEKHLLDYYNQEELKHQFLIYKWRGQSQSKHILEPLALNEDPIEPSETTCMNICLNHERKIRLSFFSEKVYKLYEYNPKILFDERDQFRVIQEICRGIKVLVKKFGYFKITKEMVGYNAEKQAKAWIHQNYASNFVQFKQKIKNEEEKSNWQKGIISQLASICLSTSKNLSSSKFYAAIQFIQEQNITSLDQLDIKFKNYLAVDENNINLLSKQQIIDTNTILEKEINSSTGVNEKQRVKNKKYEYVPVTTVRRIYPVSQPGGKPIRNTYHHPDPINLIPIQTNYVDHKKHHESFTVDQLRFPILNHSYDSNLRRLKDKNKQKPKFGFADLQPLKEEQSVSVDKETIKMVDSVIMMQHQPEVSKSPNHKIVLEESIIIKSCPKRTF